MIQSIQQSSSKQFHDFLSFEQLAKAQKLCFVPLHSLLTLVDVYPANQRRKDGLDDALTIVPLIPLINLSVAVNAYHNGISTCEGREYGGSDITFWSNAVMLKYSRNFISFQVAEISPHTLLGVV